MKKGTLYWITGLSGAGKTTIGNRLYYEIHKQQNNVVLLDGDILKKIISDNKPSYTLEDRCLRAHKYTHLCKVLTDQGIDVVCCTIAMFDEVREWNRENIESYVEVFLDVPMAILRKRNQKGMYSKQANGEDIQLPGVNLKAEYPKNPDIVIVNDGSLSVEDCVRKILSFKVAYRSDYDRDTRYWNTYYRTDLIVKEPSLFAQTVMNKLSKGSRLLELGCGNGRDSSFFARNGINVIAIDASDTMIDKLITTNNFGVNYVCADFVKWPIEHQYEFDYIYSRFSLHAIDEYQEDEIIKNAYTVLKKGGIFFIEARSIHDEIYGKGTMVGRNAYIYNDHYRRFIDKDELVDKLLNVGFKNIDAREDKGYAPFGESDPLVIRVSATK